MASSSSILRKTKPRAPVLRAGDALGAGDSYVVENLLPPELASVAFERMQNEVKWQTMHHRGGEVPRLVAVEGEVAEDGSFPLYRHPADESPPLAPFSPTVALIREHVEKVLNRPVNHVLIQYYRTGKDHISEHSDKTIDVVRDSSIVNVSLGARRVMTLRLKTGSDKVLVSSQATTKPSALPLPSETLKDSPGVPRSTQHIPLPHNSMFVMGLGTNSKWLHGINPDKRPLRLKSPEEKLKGGGRISLTFRCIGTFLNSDETRIWGQGARNKEKKNAGPVVSDKRQVRRLISAFGVENQRSDFNWEAAYGHGFDILHFGSKA